MAISPATLLEKTTVQLQALRADYIDKRRSIPRQRRTRSRNLTTDILRCSDAIRIIDDILRVRSRQRRALAEFE